MRSKQMVIITKDHELWCGFLRNSFETSKGANWDRILSTLRDDISQDL